MWGGVRGPGAGRDHRGTSGYYRRANQSWPFGIGHLARRPPRRGNRSGRQAVGSKRQSDYEPIVPSGGAVDPGGQMDMQQLLAAAQQMQDQLMNAQRELADAEVEGTAGGGLVMARVNGQGDLVELTISPAVIDATDPAETAETVADLVLAAVRDAYRAAAELQQEKMGPLAAGLGGLGGGSGLPDVPGLPDLPGLPGFPGTGDSPGRPPGSG